MENKTDPFKIGKRLRRARQARGLSLQALAEQLSRPVTRAALSKYELGKTVPRADVLLDLARVLALPASHFLHKPESGNAVHKWFAYRKHSKLGTRRRESIQARAELLGEAYLQLVDWIEPASHPSLPARRPALTADDSEAAASELRQRWQLGIGPIADVVSRCEDAGLLVIGWTEGGKFDALSGLISERWPVVVLNIDRPADRRRFNLAHEIGHLVMDTSSLKPAEEENMAHRFAAAFLVPAESARRELGVRRRQLTQAELEHLKSKYGISMQAWTRRARDLGIVTEQTYRHWQIWFRSHGHHVRETVDYTSGEKPNRLRLLFIRALAERLADREWVRALCPEALADVEAAESHGPIALANAPEETRHRILEKAAAEAAADYASDPEVDEFLGFDDEEPKD